MLTNIMSLIYIVAGYLLGSICSAVIICRLFSLPDPRTQGSNNPGATNVLRIAGKPYAIMVLLADMLKGFIPVIIAYAFGANATILGYVCFAAVLGHVYPVFFKFKGGKGVATALGGLLGVNFLLGSMTLLTWLVVAVISRYSSLAAIVAIVLAPFYSILVHHNLNSFIPLALVTLLVVYKHHANLVRLMDGTEPKINT